MIWDPSEKEALPLTTKFFTDLLQHVQTFQKDSIKMFELRRHHRKNTPYKSYIGSKMIIMNTNKICEVIAVQKKEGNTKDLVKMMVISEDGKDLEEIYGTNLKKMIDHKTHDWMIIGNNPNDERTSQYGTEQKRT